MYLVDEFHMQVSQLSEYIAWVAVPIIVVNVGLTEYLSKKFSAKKMAVVSAILTGVFMVIIVMSHSENARWITLFLASAALAICLPSCATVLSLAVAPENQGKVMGNNQSL